MTLALILGAGIGLSLGLLGGGGSIITVPVLVYAAGVSAAEAVGMSLAVVGGTSLAGAAIHWRRGLLHRRAALLFSATGTAGALLGSQLTHLVPAPVLLMMFGLLMLAVASFMLLRKNSAALEPAAECRWTRCAGAGFGVGALTGFLGVGGGFLIVPAMMIFGRLPLKTAVGTSLLVIAANSAAGLVGHMGHGSLDWLLTALFLLVALGGMGVGLTLSRKISTAALNRSFAWFVVAVALFVIGKNWNMLL